MPQNKTIDQELDDILGQGAAPGTLVGADFDTPSIDQELDALLGDDTGLSALEGLAPQGIDQELDTLLGGAPTPSGGFTGITSIGKARAKNLGTLGTFGMSASQYRHALAVEDEAREAGLDLEEKPGIFSRVIDVLSRFNFAIAGGVEAAFDDDPDTNPFGRAARDFFSGVDTIPEALVNWALPKDWEIDLPDVRGEKRAFGEVFERLGMPELGSLSDLAPGMFTDDPEEAKKWFTFLEGGHADITGRGTIGLAADIILDPLTYITAGIGKFGQVLITKGGKVMTTKALTRAGSNAVEEMARKTLGLTDAGINAMRRSAYSTLPNKGGQIVVSEADPLIRDIIRKTVGKDTTRVRMDLLPANVRSKLSKEAVQLAKEKMAKQFLDTPEVAAKWFDDGGIRFMGQTIKGTPEAIRVMSQTSASVLRRAETRLLRASANGRKAAEHLLRAQNKIAGLFKSVGKFLSRDVSKDPIYRLEKQLNIDAAAARRAELLEEMEKAIGSVRWNDKQWAEATMLIDRAHRSASLKLAQQATEAGLYQFGILLPIAKLQSIDEVLDLATNIDKKEFRRVAQFITGFTERLDQIEFGEWRKDIASLLGKGKGLPDEVLEDLEVSLRIAGVELLTPSNVTARREVNIAEAATRAIDRFEQNFRKLNTTEREMVRTYAVQNLLRNSFSRLPQFFDNHAGEITHGLKQMSRREGLEFVDDALSGRHMGVFSQLSAATIRKLSRQMRVADRGFPHLNPVNDLRDAMTRRVDLHVDDVFTRQWERTLLEKFASDTIPVAVDDIFKGLQRTEGLSKEETDKVARLWTKIWSPIRQKIDAAAKGGVKQVRLAGKKQDPRVPLGIKRLGEKLNTAQKREWLRLELNSLKTRRDIGLFFERYADWIIDDIDVLPRYKSLGQYLSPLQLGDPTAFKVLDLDKLGKKVELPMDIWDDVTRQKKPLLNSREANVLLRQYDAANNFFKLMVTALHPAFHVRNFYSNISLAFTDVGVSFLNPLEFFTTISIQRQAFKGGKIVGGDLTDRLGRLYTGADQIALAKRHGVIAEGEDLFEFTGNFSKFAANKLVRPFKKVGLYARGVGRGIENEARLQLFRNHLRRGLDPEHAAAEVKRVLYDYANLSPGEKLVMRRLVPFYTFSRKNIPQMMNQLVRNPGRVAAQLKTVRGRRDENDRMALWEVDGTIFRLNGDGETVHVLTGVDLPVGQLGYFDVLMTKGKRGERGRELMAMLSPLLRTGPELLLNVETFSGKPLDRRQNNLVGAAIEKVAPKPVQDFLGLEKHRTFSGKTRYTFNGKLFYALFESWAFSRILRTSDKGFDAFVSGDNVELQQFILNAITAMKARSLDLSEEDEKRLYFRTKDLEQRLIEEGRRRGFTRTYRPRGIE